MAILATGVACQHSTTRTSAPPSVTVTASAPAPAPDPVAAPVPRITGIATCDQFLALLAKKKNCITTKPLVRDTMQSALDMATAVGAPPADAPKDVVDKMAEACRVQMVTLYSPDDDCFNDATRAQTACEPSATVAPLTVDDSGIRRIDDTHVGVSRELVDALVADPTKLWVDTHYESTTNHIGIRVNRPSSSLLAQLGFLGTTVIHAINGIELANAHDAREVVAQLKGASELRVDWYLADKMTMSHFAICNRLISIDESAQESDSEIGPPLPMKDEWDINYWVGKGVRRVDATHVDVARAVGEQVTRSPMAYFGGVRAVRAMLDGAARGIILYAVDKSPLLGRLGLVNGDIVRAIDDVAIVSSEQVVALLPALLQKKSIRVTLTRNGAPAVLYIMMNDRAMAPPPPPPPYQ